MKTSTKKKDLTATVDQGEVLRQVAAFDKELVALDRKLGTDIAVEDADDYRAVGVELIAVVEKRKRMEEWREGFLAKVQEIIDYVDATFGPTMEKNAAMEASFRKAISEYALELDAKALGLRKAAAKLPARDEERAAELLDQAKELVPPKVAGIALTSKVRVEIVDEKRIPDEFFKRVVDSKKIEAALEAGDAVVGARLIVEKGVRVTPSQAKERES